MKPYRRPDRKPRKRMNSLAVLKTKANNYGNKTVCFETTGGAYKITFPEIKVEIRLPVTLSYEQLKAVFNTEVKKLQKAGITFYTPISDQIHKAASLTPVERNIE